MSNRDPLPVIRKVFRQHAGRPEFTASFLADEAMKMLGLAASDSERERYRSAAADWLRDKFVTAPEDVTKRGRPTAKPDGPMTAAERQARRRKRVRKSINLRRKTLRKAKKESATKQAARQAARTRREASRAAQPLPDAAEMRVGDAREVFADRAPNSVPLILTDPPYGDEAEPLYHWLAKFAARVLIPGGSLICYTGQARLNRDIAIFDQHLRYWWLLNMPHTVPQWLFGKGVLVNSKPVLWYVKSHRRLPHSLVPDTLQSTKRDKAQHAWGQGDGGVRYLIHHLTYPGELIIDPFAGSATWGRIAASMGRRWIGADVVAGGDTVVVAGSLDEAAD